MLYLKVYGPMFIESKGRWIVIVTLPNGNKLTMTYARYLMSVHLNRYLESWEHVHHINEHKDDDRLDNLEIKHEMYHGIDHNLDGKIHFPEVVVCYQCDSIFMLTAKQVRYRKANERKGLAGPFCSCKCKANYSQGFRPHYP